MSLSRRGLLLGGAAVGALGVFEVRHKVLGAPSSPHPVPAVAGAAMVSGSFVSAAMNRVVGWSIAGSGPAFLLELHGKGGDHTAAFRRLHYDRFLAAAKVPFALVTVDGGDDTYYHRRTSGADPLGMVVSELFPVLAARGLRTDRFAVGGWSMGGYGATLLAEQLGSSRVAALAVDSPAVWKRFRDSAPGAFDDRADFERHDVLARVSRLSGIPVRVTCGTSDPLLPGARALVAAFSSRVGVSSEFGRGGHNAAWWQHAAPGQLAFVGRHLS